jgi:dipeptidyl aminopeptidase/acylaminoacyl peptidase
VGLRGRYGSRVIPNLFSNISPLYLSKMDLLPNFLTPTMPSTNRSDSTGLPRPQRNHTPGRFTFHLSLFNFHLPRFSRLALYLSLLTSHFSLLTTAALAAADTVPPKLPLQDFFRNPQAAGYTLSDDGKNLAFLAPWQNRLNIWVQSAAGGEAKRLTSVTDRDLAGVFWKGNDTILFEKDNSGDENYHLFAVSRTGGDARDLTPFPGVKVSVIDDLQDDPTHVLIQTNQRDKEVFDAYRLDVVTGKSQLVAQNPGNINAWITDWQGQIRAATTTDGVNTSLLYRKTEQDPWKTVLTTNFRETFDPECFTFDNKNLYGVSNIGRDKAAAVEFDPETGKEVRIIYENPDVDVSHIAYSKKRKVLTFVTYDDWKTEIAFLDPETEAAYQKLRNQLPGYEVARVSADLDEQNYVVRTSSDRTLGSYYLFNVSSGALRKLSDLGPWIKENQMAEMKPVEYQARDGVTIHGYLTLPKGRDPKHLPVIVNPHGGPWARDEWGFNPEVQFLANRGYAVFQPNYRGSTGYGRKFWELSFKQWGGSMQDDITDGTKWLIQQGIADPARIAIYGASYGGYAVLEALVKEPALYAAGVDYVGVSNLLKFLDTIPPYWKPELDMMHAMIGDPDKDRAWLTDHSPALNADKIQKPLFVAQGANDPRVNIDESNQIVSALRKRGISIEYMVKQNEGHGFSNQENQFDFYSAMEKFLDQHLSQSPNTASR